MSLGAYISGYVDGEGCFTVSFSKRTKLKVGWEVKPSFSVSQNEDRAQVLDLMKEYFGCGSLRRDYSDKTLKCETRNLQNLIGKIIPHFRKFPLLSAKNEDFLLFAGICGMIAKGMHLTSNGLKAILDLAFQMNPGGKRKYSKMEILYSLEKDIVSTLRKQGSYEVPTRINSGTTGGLSQPIAR